MKIDNPRYYFLPAILALLLILPAFATAQIKLQAGTEIIVAFDQDVSSKYLAPGQEIPLSLKKNIDLGGIILVKAGAPGKARVKSVQPAGKAGKPGKIVVELLELEIGSAYKTLDDQPIMLEAKDGPLSAEGKGKKTLSYLLIFGLFIKGGEAVIPADSIIQAKIKADVFVLPPEN